MKLQGTIDSSLAARMAQSVAAHRDSGLEAVARSSDEDAGQAFETYFATLLVKELRSALPEGFFSGAGSDVYAAWFDEHIGASLAERDALGFAGMIKASLQRGEVVPGDETDEAHFTELLDALREGKAQGSQGLGSALGPDEVTS